MVTYILCHFGRMAVVTFYSHCDKGARMTEGDYAIPCLLYKEVGRYKKLQRQQKVSHIPQKKSEEESTVKKN